jgi:hypothetical protein
MLGARLKPAASRRSGSWKVRDEYGWRRMRRVCGAIVRHAGAPSRHGGSAGSRTLGQGESYQVKPGQTKSNHFLIYETGTAETKIGDLLGIYTIYTFYRFYRKILKLFPNSGLALTADGADGTDVGRER